MKNVLVMITILLLVSCNKEEKQLYGNWEVYETWYKNTELESWNLALWVSPDLKITKDSWEPFIEGKCTALNGVITLEIPNGYDFSYIYFENTDELQLNSYQDGVHKFKRFFRKK